MPHLLSSVTLVHKASPSYLFLVSFLNYLNPVAIAGYFINYVTETRGATSSALGAKFLAIAQGCFAVGRFSGSGAFLAVAIPFYSFADLGIAIMRYVKPRIIFMLYLTGAFVFCCASITQRGNVGLAMLNMTLFFESVCFPTIVALGIRGIGKHTKVRFVTFANAVMYNNCAF